MKINIQNTGGTDYVEQIILKAADICELGSKQIGLRSSELIRNWKKFHWLPDAYERFRQSILYVLSVWKDYGL